MREVLTAANRTGKANLAHASSEEFIRGQQGLALGVVHHLLDAELVSAGAVVVASTRRPTMTAQHRSATCSSRPTDTPYVADLTPDEAAAVGCIRTVLAQGLREECSVQFTFAAVIGTGVAHFP